MAEPPTTAEVLSTLRDLALDLRWTWSHEADDLWATLDPDLWERFHNPWTLIQSLPMERLDRVAGDQGFLASLQALAEKRAAYRESLPTIGGEGGGGLKGVAYFSMEFGLGAALPLYAGGLGVLAGDYLKTASDLALPTIGVGLLYQEGYFRQVLDADGEQREIYPFNDPRAMPIEPARVGDEELRVTIALPGRDLMLRVWRARVGRVDLYLLDSNDPTNSGADRGVTAKLYDGDPEIRLQQELALGVGGWRIVEALGRADHVCHINEGHAAFAGVERARALAASTGLAFDEALWATRGGNVFTTHTPVAAGFDRFDPELVRRYLPSVFRLADDGHDLSAEIMALGRADPADPAEPFNMAYAAQRISAACFAVSRRHEQVSRAIFQPLFPRWPRCETPIRHVTNGVHTPSWDSAAADRVWTRTCGKTRWLDPTNALLAGIADASDEEIWTMRGEGRQALVEHVRRRLGQQLAIRGLDASTVAVAASVFDPNILTLGFARRFTDYKRPNLLLADPARLERILLDERRPAQIVVAGKAHPDDKAGKRMIRAWIEMARQPHLRRRVVFLEDYDLGLAQELVQGVDVWLNTPRRPLEACGTSGMKVLVNGGLNCSVSDGWWAEAYKPELGWRIGPDGQDHQAGSDSADAQQAYDLIERSIAPEFYDRDASGLPRAWLARVRRSMTALTGAYGSVRMTKQYLDAAYPSAAETLRARKADDYAQARDLAAWARRLTTHWPGLHIGPFAITRAGETWRLTVAVFLGDIAPEDVRVELYADPVAGDAPEIIKLTRLQPVPGSANGFVYAGDGSGGRPADDFTVRVVPDRPGAHTPGELNLITWRR